MKKKIRILIFAYYSFEDPVFQSAVLPYFMQFPNKENYQFILLTSEQKQFSQSGARKSQIREDLKKHNITWYQLNWHSGRFKLLKKAFDFVVGMVFSIFLILKHKVSIVYSEGFPGAIISHYIAKITRKKHVVHTFEPHADYMIEGGVWTENSWEGKLIQSAEKRIANQCELILTGSEAYRDIILSWGVSGEKIKIVPSCVDADFFTYSAQDRNSIRQQLNIAPEEVVITYLGKFGGMYMEEELFEFFKVCEQHKELTFRFFIFSGDNQDQINQWIDQHQLPREKVFLSFLTREEVPKYLSASDFGFVGVRTFPSKRYCSPIKDGEYWASGLPIIIPAGVSDDYLLVDKHSLGVVIDQLNPESYRSAVEKMKKYVGKRENTSIAQFARTNRDVAHFRAKYDQWFTEISGS